MVDVNGPAGNLEYLVFRSGLGVSGSHASVGRLLANGQKRDQCCRQQTHYRLRGARGFG